MIKSTVRCAVYTDSKRPLPWTAKACLTLQPWDCSLPGSSVQGFPQQEYWSGLPFPSPGDLPRPGIKLDSPASPSLQADSLPLNHLGSPCWLVRHHLFYSPFSRYPKEGNMHASSISSTVAEYHVGTLNSSDPLLHLVLLLWYMLILHIFKTLYHYCFI